MSIRIKKELTIAELCNGWNAKQFSLMVKWGMDPMNAIQSATINA